MASHRVIDIICTPKKQKSISWYYGVSRNAFLNLIWTLFRVVQSKNLLVRISWNWNLVIKEWPFTWFLPLDATFCHVQLVFYGIRPKSHHSLFQIKDKQMSQNAPPKVFKKIDASFVKMQIKKRLENKKGPKPSISQKLRYRFHHLISVYLIYTRIWGSIFRFNKSLADALCSWSYSKILESHTVFLLIKAVLY